MKKNEINLHNFFIYKKKILNEIKIIKTKKQA